MRNVTTKTATIETIARLTARRRCGVVAWKVRHALNLDNVPGGVADAGKDDNIIYDFSGGTSTSGFGHPHCLNATAESSIATALPTAYPIGATP